MDLYISTQDIGIVEHPWSKHFLPYVDLRNGFAVPFNLYFLSPDIHDRRAPFNLTRYPLATISMQLKQDGVAAAATQASWTEVVPNWSNGGTPQSTITVTIASPGVVTWTGSNFSAGQAVVFQTTGALPTGINPNQIYYVLSPTANTFQISATPSGPAINTSGSQSGTHTGFLIAQGSRIVSGTSTKGEYDRVLLADVPASGSFSINMRGGVIQTKGAASSTTRIYPGISTPTEVEGAMAAIVGAPYLIEFLSPTMYDIHGSACPGTAPFVQEVNCQDLQFLFGWNGSLDLTAVPTNLIGANNLYLIVMLTPNGGTQFTALKLAVNLLA